MHIRTRWKHLMKMYKSFVLAMFVSLIVSRSGAQDVGQISDLPKSSVRYAVLVGVESYDDSNISQLNSPTNDVNLMKESLEKYAGFTDDNIALLSTATKRKPTRDEILATLSKIRGLVPTDGLLLFMFSGHGISRGDKAFLLPSNARLTSDLDLL